MKKTLIALAALAATASFAQSSVSIIGTIDLGIKSVSAASAATGNTATFNNNASQTAVNTNNTATSALKFIGTEDLGGGMKAGFLMELNPNLANSTTTNLSTSAASAYTGTPFNGEQFLSLGGNFGEVKLGNPNAGFYGAASTASPLGTGMASGYSTSFGRLGGATPLTTGFGGSTSAYGTNFPGIGSDIGGTAGSRIIRHDRTVQYTTPVFSGFKATFDYSAGNDNSATATSNTDTYAGVALTYSKGALNVAYAYANTKFGTLPVAFASMLGSAAVTSTTIGVNGTDLTNHVLAANYNFGAATVYGGYTISKSNNPGTAFLDDKSWNIAGKYAVGSNIELVANYLVRTSDVSVVNNAKVYGGGADYILSKRTNLYARYELIDVNTDSKFATPGGSITNAFALGVKHTF